MKEFYRINVAGLERDLPICPLNDKLCIAGFVIFGDVELTVNSARTGGWPASAVNSSCPA